MYIDNIFYQEIDFIPTVPAELIMPLDKVEQAENLNFRKDPDIGSYFLNDSLRDWIEPFFDFAVQSRYQILKKVLPIHADGFNTLTWKYIYVYETGGENVKTIWYNSVMDNRTIKSVVLKKNTWYKINIKIPHTISSVSSPRCSITLWKSDEN